MSVLLAPSLPLSRLSLRSVASYALALATVVLAITGAASPWLTLFNGLSSVAGLTLDGGYLATIVAISVTALFVMTTCGGGISLRVAAISGGVAVFADSLLSGTRIAAYVAHPGPAAALTAPTATAGPWIMAASGVALIGTALLAPAARIPLHRPMVMRLLLSIVLIIAAGIHFMLSPQHFAESPLLGAGFLIAAIAQLALAVVVITRSDDTAIGLTLTVTIALIAIYIYAVLIGLPLDSSHTETASGLRLGNGETIDLKGLINLLAEVAAIPLAILVSRNNLRAPRERN